MPSPNGAMKSRSVLNHAGIPQLVTTTFTVAAGAEAQIVVASTNLQQIKLHAYQLTTGAAGEVTLASSGTTETTLIGQMELAKGTPLELDRGLDGIGTCSLDHSLAVSSAVTARGNVTYSLIP